jgi:hypothetical protein
MRSFVVLSILFFCVPAFAQQSAPPPMTPEQAQLKIMAGIAGDQSVENARLTVIIMQRDQAIQKLQGDLATANARADSAEAKLKAISPAPSGQAPPAPGAH